MMGRNLLLIIDPEDEMTGDSIAFFRQAGTFLSCNIGCVLQYAGIDPDYFSAIR